jgi:cell division protein FtsI/penicillin-binding protein 2
LVNGGDYIKPTVIEAIYSPNQQQYIQLWDKQQWKIFKPSTSVDIKDALVSVVDNGNLSRIAIPWFGIGWKTGTSEIAYKWKYQWGRGRTNGSFVGMVTHTDTKYVVAIQVRRPRSSPWWLDTAWRVFESVAEFLLSYDKIEK